MRCGNTVTVCLLLSTVGALTDSNDISGSAYVVSKRACKIRMLTEEQRMKIKIEILVAGGYEEMADRAVKNISDIVAGKVNRRFKRSGRRRLSLKEIDDTIGEIKDLQRRNPHLQSDRSIANRTNIDRRRVKRARCIMARRVTVRFFRALGRKYPAPKTILNS